VNVPRKGHGTPDLPLPGENSKSADKEASCCD
jgi:hypothetical protein